MSMELPEEIRQAFAGRKVVGLTKPGHPLYYAWVFDSRDAQVHLSDDHHKPRRHKDHHKGLAKKLDHHPLRVHGYAYRVHGGWRITDWDHAPVDRFIGRAVTTAIKEHESSEGTSDDHSSGGQDSGVSD